MAISEEPIHSFFVSKEEADLRLDKLLGLHYPGHSRTYFQFLIEQGSVLVNEKIIKKREKPKVGDEIAVCFLYTQELSLEPEDIPLEILYEDEHLIAINKPAQMVVHPAPGHPKGTFVNALLFHCKAIAGMDPIRPGIVHRIDKETSGVLIAAKTIDAHRALVKMFSERTIEKTYLAICIGKPQEGLIDLPIGRHPLRRKEMSVRPDGKEAKTVLRLKSYKDPLSLIELDLLTGRTHQIRVHLKHLGTPLLGDTVYGSSSTNKKFDTKRQFLHAARIRFLHPFKNCQIDLTAPLPSDFASMYDFF